MATLLAFDATLQRPLFDLVVATLWADGEVADREIAAAVWTALADRTIDPGESRFLRELRRTLALDDGAVRFADGLARWIHARAGDEELPPHRAFARLLIEGARRVVQIEARRTAAAA